MTEFGTVTQVRPESSVLLASATPPSKGGVVPASAKLLLNACTQYENNNQILHGDQTTWGEIFTGRPRISDLFAVAKLLVKHCLV